MPEVVCDASPIQYLHQTGLLDLLHLRYGAITIPTAVAAELREGTLRGIDLPAFEALDWIRIRQPAGRLLLPIGADLGAGEREVLALGTETSDSLLILDDALARQHTRMLKPEPDRNAGCTPQGEGGGPSPRRSTHTRSPRVPAVPNGSRDSPSGAEAGWRGLASAARLPSARAFRRRVEDSRGPEGRRPPRRHRQGALECTSEADQARPIPRAARRSHCRAGLPAQFPRCRSSKWLRRWSRRSDLNRGPADYESAALPLSYAGRVAGCAGTAPRRTGS